MHDLILQSPVIARLHAPRLEYSLVSHLIPNVKYKIMHGFYARTGEPSRMEPCHMIYQSNGNFELSNVNDFFPNEQNVRSTLHRNPSADTEILTIVILFDITMHAVEKDCPYLFLVLDNNFSLRCLTLDDTEKLAEAFA